MNKNTPKDVLKAVSADLKLRGLTHENAAQKMGFTNKQTLSNLLSSKRYVSGYQAKKFNDAFGYNMDFLMSGEGELQPYRGTHGSTPLGQLAYEYGMKTLTVIDGTAEGEMDLILSWMHTLLSKQKNEEGLALLSDIYRYSRARNIVRQQMQGYRGEFFELEFEDRLNDLQCQIVENINKKLSSLPEKKKPKVTSHPIPEDYYDEEA